MLGTTSADERDRGVHVAHEIRGHDQDGAGRHRDGGEKLPRPLLFAKDLADRPHRLQEAERPRRVAGRYGRRPGRPMRVGAWTSWPINWSAGSGSGCWSEHLWASINGVKLDFSRPRKPTDNAVIESFNGRLRDECLNQHWFLSLDEARAVTQAWRDDYNRVRPHDALGNRTPSEFARPVAGHAQLPALHG